VRENLLSEEMAQQSLEKALKDKIPFINYLVQNKIVPARAIATTAARDFSFPLLDLDTVELDSKICKLVKKDLIIKHQILPIYKRNNYLFVALTDPTNLQGLDEIKFHASGQILEDGIRITVVEPVIVEQDKLAIAIERSTQEPAAAIQIDEDVDLDSIETQGGDIEAQVAEDVTSEAEEAPIVKFVKQVLLTAIRRKASDIHIEPYEKTCRVRFRQDGILQEYGQPIPVNLAGRVAARVKVMSKMDISEKRVPQDGRIKLYLTKTQAIDFRVNTCPTLWGEKIVLRILDPSQAKLGIDALGYEPIQKASFMKAIHRPQGMVLVTGPTGSGKTVSLYTAVNILNKPEHNICTAEDPVEINLEGINQVNINAKVGLDFSSALRAFLRQDPDVILVGEIRDKETAEIAIKAAQTGHMVLSTLHTNDAPQTLTRLVNMGIPAYNIASSVSLIIAQRLARRLCPNCKRPANIPPEELIKEGFSEEEIQGLTIYEAVGCSQCTNGYKGRVGVYQVMPISEEIGRIIMAGGNAIQIADQARSEGIADLRRSGLNKIKQGVTSLADINRITVE